MNIGDVSEQLGIPASTIRYYEREGLIEPQPRIGGRRRFTHSAVTALKFVQLAQSAGFTIAETRTLLAQNDDVAHGQLWKPLAEQKQTEIKQKISDLQLMNEVLEKLTGCQCTTVAQCVGASNTSCLPADSRVATGNC